jgi:hypothetical protein
MRRLLVAGLLVCAVVIGATPLSAAAGGPPPAPMDDIYAALHIENLRTESGATSFPVGTNIRFAFDLVSDSRRPLVVPFDTQFGFYLLGTQQTWILRLGADPSLPMPFSGRKGDWYAAGGSIIVATDLDKHQRVVFDATFPLLSDLPTPGFPPGTYRYFVEYKPVGGGLNDVIQTVQIDITLT